MATFLLVTIIEKVLMKHANDKLFSFLFILELVFYVAIFAGLMGSRVYELPSFLAWVKNTIPR